LREGAALFLGVHVVDAFGERLPANLLAIQAQDQRALQIPAILVRSLPAGEAIDVDPGHHYSLGGVQLEASPLQVEAKPIIELLGIGAPEGVVGMPAVVEIALASSLLRDGDGGDAHRQGKRSFLLLQPLRGEELLHGRARCGVGHRYRTKRSKHDEEGHHAPPLTRTAVRFHGSPGLFSVSCVPHWGAARKTIPEPRTRRNGAPTKALPPLPPEACW